MHELTPDNALDYLREKNLLEAGAAARVEALGWGVSNLVLRVESGPRRFVLKQSRPQLRTKDAWFSDLDRVYREQEVMQLLHPLLGPVVPAVLFVDRDNFVFAMSHAPLEARVWKEMLLAGEVDQGIAVRAGRVLGKMHQATAASPSLVEPFRDHKVFVQLRAEPFYERIQERCPEVAARVRTIEERMLATKEALCHGDFSPKNMLVHAGDFTLVDYETGCFGDPTMDLGFFLSHLMLKAIKRHKDRGRYFELTRSFWDSYAEEVRFRPLVDLEERGSAHFGVCLLARIDGTSPVDYLSEEEKRDVARRLGRQVLLEPVKRWADVLDLCEGLVATI
ncbi:MAG: phosphotransferase family protein [Gemmataceae bacterium]